MTNSRAKGIRGELEAVKLWRDWFPDCQRSFGQARRGYEQPDIIGGGIERCFYIEVKRTKKPPTSLTLWKWGQKAIVDSLKFGEMADFRPEYILVMWRYDNIKEWELMLMKGAGDFKRTLWSDFEAVLDKRFGVYD